MFRRCSSVSGYSNVETKRAFTCVLQFGKSHLAKPTEVAPTWKGNSYKCRQSFGISSSRGCSIAFSVSSLIGRHNGQGGGSAECDVFNVRGRPGNLQLRCPTTSTLHTDVEGHYSRALGLKENEAKTNYVCSTAAQNQSLEREGVDPKCVIEQIRVLGIDVVPTSWHESETMLKKRCEDGLSILNRLAFCPIGREVRRAFYRSRVIPIITWGAWLKPLPARVAKEVSRLYRSLSRGHPMGSKPLRTIMEGHHADPIFSCLQQSIQAAQRAHKFRRLRWRGSPPLAGWQHAIVDCLSKYGWEPLQHWVLQHPQEGRCHVLQDGESAMHKFHQISGVVASLSLRAVFVSKPAGQQFAARAGVV